jgi:hypothetical protein
VVGLKWGVNGVAMAYVVVSALLVIPNCYIPFRLIGLRLDIYFRHFTSIAVASMLMTIAMEAMKEFLMTYTSDVLRLVICVGIGLLTYVASLLIIDRNMLKELFEHIKHQR